MTRQPTVRRIVGMGAGLMLVTGTFGAGGHFFGLPALAQTGQEPTEICPYTDSVKDGAGAVVQRSELRVGVLQAGTSAAEVERALGRPTVVIVLDSPETSNRELIYAEEPLRTRVVLTGGRVTEVTLDLGYFDPVPLPPRARVVKATMVRDGVLGLLGRPDGGNRWTESGVEIEQMIFARLREPDFSVILADGLVADVRLGHTRPSGVSCMLLPVAAADTSVARDLRIGLTQAQTASFLGPAESTIASSFKGQPVEYASYNGRDGSGMISLTFTGGVLTAFKIWPPDTL
jgi:hypothetical protein